MLRVIPDSQKRRDLALKALEEELSKKGIEGEIIAEEFVSHDGDIYFDVKVGTETCRVGYRTKTHR